MEAFVSRYWVEFAAAAVLSVVMYRVGYFAGEAAPVPVHKPEGIEVCSLPLPEIVPFPVEHPLPFRDVGAERELLSD